MGSTVVDAVSHLILQIHLGPTREEKLYYVSMSTITGLHEGSPAPLRNRMRQALNITCDEHGTRKQGKVCTYCKVYSCRRQIL